MAKARKFVAYRRLERPYTRVSKYRKKNYVRSNPAIVVVRYDMGDCTQKYDYAVNLISKDDMQIRHNAIESGRQVANRVLETAFGKTGYHLQLRKYPHHILRENPLASGAGADRMSTGMAASFGKAIGHAAQIRRGEPIMTVYINKDKLPEAKIALKKASYKFPHSFLIVATERKK